MAPTKKGATVPAAETPAAETPNTGLSTQGQYNWFKEKLNEDTGELEQVQRIKYMPGMPREYRFDAKSGNFSIGANAVIGRALTVQPIAWRFFTDDIFGLGEKFWAELFFVDDKSCVAAVLMHSASAQELQKLAEPLYYDEKGLNDVVIDIYVTDHVNNKIKPAANYTIARFDKYTDADPELVKEYRAFVREFPIFRKASWTPKAVMTASKYYFDPSAAGHELSEPAPDAGTGAEQV